MNVIDSQNLKKFKLLREFILIQKLLNDLKTLVIKICLRPESNKLIGPDFISSQCHEIDQV